MEFNDNKYHAYYNAISTGNTCASAAILYFRRFHDTAQKTTGFCPAPVATTMAIDTVAPFELLEHVSHILCTILPSLFWFALARVITQEWKRTHKTNSIQRFILEFLVIAVPTVYGINVNNDWVEYIVVGMTALLAVLIWKTGCIQKASKRTYLIGSRPKMLTLGRATINFLTAYCILAIDFETFPKKFRKTRQYGAGLMDTGIGLFVFAMGSVSRRPQSNRDHKHMLRIVLPLLFLGIARTVVLQMIDYQQDEHEYGRDLNAFFTLGLTKLLGHFFSATAVKDWLLLPIGFGVLAMHEMSLLLGLSQYVMNTDLGRDNFIRANREGLFSLPGFVGIYLISMFLGYLWQTPERALSFKQILQKMTWMTLMCLFLWLLTFFSIFTPISIARVTCNFGYAFWILGIASLMVLSFMIIFDLVLNTLWPMEETMPTLDSEAGEGASLLKTTSSAERRHKTLFVIPTLVEAVNMNGLTFFLVANILTGCVNMFLEPKVRTDNEGYAILIMYMWIATGAVYILYRRNWRIG